MTEEPFAASTAESRTRSIDATKSAPWMNCLAACMLFIVLWPPFFYLAVLVLWTQVFGDNVDELAYSGAAAMLAAIPSGLAAFGFARKPRNAKLSVLYIATGVVIGLPAILFTYGDVIGWW